MTDQDRTTLPDGYKVEGCNVNNDGHCALHGIEIERRRSTQRELEAVKAEAKETRKDMGFVCAFISNLKGGIRWGGALALLVVLGSYTYIYNHIQEARVEKLAVVAEIHLADRERKDLRDALATLKVEQGRNDERAAGINSRLSSIDGRLAQLVGLMINAEKISTEGVMDMYKEN